MLVVAFNVVGFVDIPVDYYHGVAVSLADIVGELGATYRDPDRLCALLMITHIAAFYLLARQPATASTVRSVIMERGERRRPPESPGSR
jgi:hypothetical protein